MRCSVLGFRVCWLYRWRVLACLLLLVMAGSLLHAQDAGLPPLRSAAEDDLPPFSIVDAQGRADGFSVELLSAAVQSMGRTVTYRTGPWAEVREWLEAGEVQALPVVGRTPEREELFDFTFPYMTLHGAVVVREDETRIRGFEDLGGHRVATMKGDNAEEFLRRVDRDFEIVARPTFTDALRDLAAGHCDAVVMQRLVALRLLQESGIKGLRVLNRPIDGYEQAFCFAVKEGDRETLDLLNEGLSVVIADGTFRRLHVKWFAALQLPMDRRIIVGGDHNFPPFEFLDENGHPAGYNVEQTRAIARELGLEIEIQLSEWTQVVRRLEAGEIDVIQGMLYSPHRDARFDFTSPFAVNHYVGVVRRGEGSAPASVEDLRDKQVVVQGGDIMHEFVSRHGLGPNVFVVESQEEALRQLAAGRHDCALVARMTALYWIEREGWANLDVGGASIMAPEYCMAVNSGQRAMLAEFDEGLHMIEASGELRRIREKWLGVYEEESFTLLTALRYAAIILLPLLILLGLTLIWSWALRRQVAHRTRELQRSERQFRALVEGAPEGIFVQTEQRFAYVNAEALRMLGAESAEELLGRPVLERFPERERETVRERVRLLNDAKSAVPMIEEIWVRMDGTEIPVEVSAVPMHFQGQDGALVFVRNISERKQAADALKASEARLRTLVETMPDMVWLKDTEGRFLFCNQRFARFMEMTEEQILGRTDFELLDEGLARAYQEQDLAVLASGVMRWSEDELFCVEENHLDVYETVKTPLFGESGEITGLLGISRNITARRKIEEQVQYQAILLHEMGRIAKIGGWEFDPSTGRGTWTEEVARIHDVDPEEETNFELGISFFHGEHRVKIEEAVRKAIEEGTPYDLELEMVSAKGVHRWVRTIGQPRIEDGKVVQLRGSFQDITERKQIEFERERLMFAIEQADETILITSPEGIMQYVNPAFERVTGYSREEAIGRHVRMIESDKHSEVFYQEVLDVLQSGQTWKGRFINKSKDGKLFTEEATISPVFDSAGRIVNHVSVKRDITRELQLERQLVQSQKMEAVGRLAGGVAHDFNNILQAISGYGQLLKDDTLERGGSCEEIDEILLGAERAAGLTRQLLSFSRRQVMEPRVLDLNEVVANMLKMLRRVIGEHILLEWLPGSQLGSVSGDPGMIEQVLMNLCVNARDAISGVGNVVIETQNVRIDSDYCATHSWAKPGRFVLLSVTDTGRGMNAETLEHAFEPFFTTKGEEGGTGLGLATVFGIVKQHDGMISAYSEPGQGTTLKVYLPVVEQRAESIGTLVEGPLVGGTETILLAEDDEKVRELGRVTLERAGYRVLVARNGEEAVEIFQSQGEQVDLLLLDVVMPGLGGKEAHDRIDALRPGIATLFTSGYTENAIHTDFVLHEGLTLIQKPFSASTLLRAVRKALDRQGAFGD